MLCGTPGMDWGEQTDSSMEKNGLTKLLIAAASGRPFNPTTWLHRPAAHDRHTDTRLALSTLCPPEITAGTIPKWSRAFPGAWDSRNSEGGRGEEEPLLGRQSKAHEVGGETAVGLRHLQALKFPDRGVALHKLKVWLCPFLGLLACMALFYFLIAPC